MLIYLFLLLHIVAALVLIGVVLLQSGKAGDLASAFGGATSQTAFGARGATTFLSKATTVCAVLFMFTSLSLSILYTRSSTGTVMEGLPTPEPTTTEPAATTPPATPPAAGETSPPAESTTPPAEGTATGSETATSDPQPPGNGQ